MTTAHGTHGEAEATWAELNGRWFFAWRMAAACQSALEEIHSAMGHQQAGDRQEALEQVSKLLRKELVRWVRRGEALDMIVERLPRQTS